MRTSVRLSLLALLGLAATASGGGGGGARRSTLVRAPAETAATAQWAAAGLDGGATVARWDAGAGGHGKGAAWPWWLPLPPAPDGDHNNERAHLVGPAGAGALDLLDFPAEEEAPDPLSSVERAAAAEEERAMWQALLSAVSATGEVAVQFDELVRLGGEVRFLLSSLERLRRRADVYGLSARMRSAKRHRRAAQTRCATPPFLSLVACC